MASWTYLFAAIAFVACQVSADENMSELFTKCAKKHGVSQDSLIAVMSFTSADGIRDKKCFVKCLFEEFKLFKDDGVLDVSKTLAAGKKINKDKPASYKEKSMKKGHECLVKVNKADGCEKFFEIMECYINGMKKI